VTLASEVVIAEKRRIDLLRCIADAGGAIEPHPNPQTPHGYEYRALAQGVERDLQFLTEREYLDARFLDRVSLCPKCQSHHLNVREICPGCRRAHLATEVLLHHFRCGYTGRAAEFASDHRSEGGYTCPKCNRQMRHLGTEYDRLGRTSVCRECGLSAEDLPVEAVCLACGIRTLAENLTSIDFFAYALTSLGRAAIRNDALLEHDDQLLFISGPRIYRRRVMIEFLGQEIKRLDHFKVGFSLLMAEYRSPAADDDHREHWLSRLRQCLRDMDLIGQLSNTLFVAILPQTTLRVAEELRQRILAGLGPQPPLTLTTIEVTEPSQIAPILARGNSPSAQG
jgi:ssDNA-binding Zn-finger/Zn-ribbon topoisomerase 1